MKNKIIAIVLVVFLFGLSFFAWVKPATEFSQSERRVLAQFPKLTFNNIISGKFMKDFETYATEQFPLRDSFRTIKALTNFYVLGQSDNNDLFFKNGHIGKI
jgi:hypothetical protein